MLKDGPPLGNAELVQLRTRMIAMENTVIAMLASHSEDARANVLNLSEIILPDADATQHQLTIDASNLMKHYVERAAKIGQS